MRTKKTVFLFSVFIFLGVSSVSAASIQSEGLQLENFNMTFINDTAIRFETGYLTKTLKPEKVFNPDELSQYRSSFSYSLDSWSGGSGVATMNIQYKVYSNADYPKPVLEALLGENVSVQDYPSNYYQYDSSGYWNESQSVGKVFSGQMLDGRDTTGNPDEVATKWDVDVNAHYEHLVIDYTLQYNNSGTWRTVWTGQDVYSGEKTTRIPVSGGVEQLSAGKVRQTITHDNLYEKRETEKLVIAHSPRTNISGIDFNGLAHEKIGSVNYSELVEPELDAANISTGRIDNRSDYRFVAYNVTYPADTRKSVAIKFSQPVYNPLTDNPENFQFDYYSYILGSVATFKTDTSSEWDNGTFTDTVENSGNLELSLGGDGDMEIVYNTGANGNTIIADAETGEIEFNLSRSIKAGPMMMKDNDNDGLVEIVGRDYDNNDNIGFLDASGEVQTTTTGTFNGGSVTGNYDSDNLLETLIVDSNDNVIYIQSNGTKTDTGIDAGAAGGGGLFDGDSDLDMIIDRSNNVQGVDSSGNIVDTGYTFSLGHSVGGVGNWQGDSDNETAYVDDDASHSLLMIDSNGNELDTGIDGADDPGCMADLDADSDEDILYALDSNASIRYADSSGNVKTGLGLTLGSGDPGCGDFGYKSSGSYTSAVYSASEEKIWDNITVGNYAKNGGTIDIWVMTSNDGSPSTSPLEKEKISSSELSSSGTTTIDLGFTQGATDVKYNISYTKGSSSPSIDSIEIDGKTANQAPEYVNQEFRWTQIGGSGEDKEVNFTISDLDGLEISDHNTPPSGSELEFTNSSYRVNGISSPFDYLATITDFSAATGNTEANYTSTDRGVNEDPDFSHTVDTQQINQSVKLNIRGNQSDYEFTFKKRGSVVSSGTTQSTSDASGVVTSTEVWSVDNISEKQFSFTPNPDLIYLHQNYEASQVNQYTNDRADTGYTGINNTGSPTTVPSCTQITGNTTTFDLAASAKTNITTGYSCDPGDTGTPSQTIYDNNPSSSFERVWYNTTLTLNSNETQNSVIVWNISDDNLKKDGDREGGSLDAVVDGKRFGVETVDTPAAIEVRINTSFGSSSLESTNGHDSGLTYYYSTSTSGGGGGGGGGAGEQLIITGANISQTRFQVPVGTTGTDRFTVLNTFNDKPQNVTVNIPSEKKNCQRFSVETKRGSNKFAKQGFYRLEPFAPLSGRATPQVQVKMPDETFFANRENNTIRCPVNIGVTEGSPPTDVVFVAEAEEGFLARLKAFIQFNFGINLEADLISLPYCSQGFNQSSLGTDSLSCVSGEPEKVGVSNGQALAGAVVLGLIVVVIRRL